MHEAQSSLTFYQRNNSQVLEKLKTKENEFIALKLEYELMSCLSFKKDSEVQRLKSMNLENEKCVSVCRLRYVSFLEKYETLWEDLYANLEELPDPQSLINLNSKLVNLETQNTSLQFLNVQLTAENKSHKNDHQENGLIDFQKSGDLFSKIDGLNFETLLNCTNEISKLETQLYEMNERIIKIEGERHELLLKNSKLESLNLSLTCQLTDLAGQLTERRTVKINSGWVKDQTLQNNQVGLGDEQGEEIHMNSESQSGFILPGNQNDKKNGHLDFKKEFCFDCRGAFQKRNRIKNCDNCKSKVMREFPWGMFWSD